MVFKADKNFGTKVALRGFAHFRLPLHPSLRAGRLSAVLQSLALFLVLHESV